MRVAVIGGTGLIGAEVVRLLNARSGTEAVVISRSAGVDVLTGDGLATALKDVAVVIDVINTDALEFDDVVAFFSTVAANIAHAEAIAGVKHHVLLSIIGVDQTREYAHFAGKLAQERIVRAGSTAFTIVRATQFYEFARMAVEWGFDGTRSHIPPLLMRPISVEDAASMLVDISLGEAVGGIVEIAGPERQDLVDVARRTLQVLGRSVLLDPSWDESGTGTEMAGNLLLPREGARIGTTTLQQWLDTQPRPSRRSPALD